MCYRIMEFKICTFWQHFFVNTNCIEHNRAFLSAYILLDPFILPYYFYYIRRELMYVLSIVEYILITFSPTLGHHQRRIYYKCDVNFLFAYYFYASCIDVLSSVICLFTTSRLFSKVLDHDI